MSMVFLTRLRDSRGCVRWMTKDDEVYTHCSGAPLVGRLALLFHFIRDPSHIEPLSAQPAPSRARTLEAGKRLARLAQARGLEVL